MNSEQQGRISVMPMNKARRKKRRFDAVVTIEDPHQRNGLRFHRAPHPDHLVLKFEDVDIRDETIALPQVGHVMAVLAFGRQHVGSDMLIHCKAGIARSTAMALAVLADRHGAGREDEAVRELLSFRPESIPNLIILDMADKILGREGALVAAWMKVENSNYQYSAHRHDKLELFRKRPELFAKAFKGSWSTILRFHTARVTPEAGAGEEFREPELQRIG